MPDKCKCDTFLYFAYGSNLLAKRIHINNPTAVREAIAKLENYRLDFNGWSSGWGGCSATIVPDKTQCIWGAVWTIKRSNLADLDRQEGVEQGLYKPIEVTVTKPDGQLVTCRSYQMNDQPRSNVDDQDLPESRRPSPIYRETILQGAIESGLPEEYYLKLTKIPHNGYTGKIDIKIDIPIKH